MIDARLDIGTLTDLRDDYLRHYDLRPEAFKPLLRRRSIIVVGGTMGSGKTTVAKETAKAFNALHVQSNSARYLLSQNSFKYGHHVGDVMELVIRFLMLKRYDIVLDGMLTEPEERELLIMLARRYHYDHFFSAVFCNIKQSDGWARKRYDGWKESSFFDWRAKPDKFERGYIDQRAKRQQYLKEQDIPGLGIIQNTGTARELRKKARELFSNLEARS